MTLNTAIDPAAFQGTVGLPVATTTLTCTTTDTGGLSTTKEWTVAVQDTTAPTLKLPSNITEEATSAAGAKVDFTTSANDLVDGTVTVSCTPASGSTFGLSTTTVNCSASDKSGNTAKDSFTVTVQDTTGPVLSGMPADRTVEATSAQGAPSSFTLPTANDAVSGNVNASVSCTPTNGSTFGLTTTTVNCSATDAKGNKSTSSFKVTVEDTTGPIITVPTVATVEATSSAGATVTFTAPSALDAVDGNKAVSCSKNSGDVFPLGDTTVTCTSTDSRNNPSSKSFTVTVQDTTAPTLKVPSNIIEEATSAAGAKIDFTTSASDRVDGTVAVSCTPASGSTFCLITTTVNCSATDAAKNTATGSFTVTVQDKTPPALTLPDDITEEATSAAGAKVDFTTSASDRVDGTVAVSCTPASGSTFGLITTTVNCSATDAAKNTATGSFTVTVRDTTAPALPATLPTITAEATSATGAAVEYTSPTATDAVDGTVTAICLPASGSTFKLGATSVSCTATDKAGNKSDAKSFTITVQDTTKPDLKLPSNITEEATSAAGAKVDFNTSASDLVDGTVAVSCTPASGSTFGLTTTTVNCSASDKSGNTAKDSFTVTVQDTTAPALPAALSNITKEATGAAGAKVPFIITAPDAVDGTVTAICLPASGSTFKLGDTSVSCTATDAAKNTATGKFTVTVQDTTAPTLTLPTDFTKEATGPNGASVSFNPTATDLVAGSTTVICDVTSGTIFKLGDTTVTCTSTDNAGNQAKGSFKVSVRDTTAPALPDTLANVAAQATNTAGEIVQYTSPTATDAVDGTVTATCTPASGSTFKLGATTVSCTATDRAGNKSEAKTFTVNINFKFNGFFQPVDMGTTLNRAKAGSAIPVKFTLGGVKTLDVLDGAPTVTAFTCLTGATDDIEQLVTANASGLQWDSTAQQYVYVWKTLTSYAGQCLKLNVRFKDGTTQSALFNFTK